MRTKKKNIRGFTLVELMTVIAIIGILSSVVIVGLSSSRERAKDRYAVSQLQSIAIEAALSKANRGNYDSVCSDVSAIVNDIQSVLGNASCTDDANSYVASARLFDGTDYCVRDTGVDKVIGPC